VLPDVSRHRLTQREERTHIMQDVVVMGVAAAPGLGTASASVWMILGAIALAGAGGGITNALLSDNGDIVWPQKEAGGILRPGILGNILLGAFAAVVSWGLYGPLKDAVILGARPPGEVAASLTITAFVGAALAGAGGARVITNEVDKQFLRGAAVGAAGMPADPELAKMILTATPADAAKGAIKDSDQKSGAAS
jgi:hypothetical protein